MTQSLFQVGLQWDNYVTADESKKIVENERDIAPNDCGGGDITKAYLRGQIGIHVHFGKRSAGTHSRLVTPEFCLLLQRPTQVQAQVGVGDRTAISLACLDDERKATVLIEVGECFESKELAPFDPKLTAVRLRPLDDCEWFTSDMRDTTPSSRRKLLLATANGKVTDTGEVFGQDTPVVPLRERERDVIEAGPQILDRVADDRGEIGRRVAELFGVDDRVARFGVKLIGDSVGLRLDPAFDPSLHGIHVLVCPSELDAPIGDLGHNGLTHRRNHD